MANKKDKDSKVEFLKVVYFDEDAAQDYMSGSGHRRRYS